MINRNSYKVIRKLLKGYPAIVLTGPRQSGKTTLAKYIFPKKPYVSLENPDTREFAENDPRAFLEKYKSGAVFDEIQNCPYLFSYLQEIIDENNKPGRFILTGSQQFKLHTQISQSLAGRVALVQLLPFSYSELYSNKNPQLDKVLFTGMYPPIHDRKLDPSIWYANYMQTYIERDVRKLINIRDLSAFQRFVRLCAGRTGQLLNLSNLAIDAGITHNTAKAWISILEASYIIFLLQPHHINFNKRIIKTPKLYFYDTGFASWLLSIQNPKQISNHHARGALFETMIISEMVKERFNKALTSNLFFWRDRSGNEIDVIIEESDILIPAEIKSGQTINSDFFKGLKYWKKLTGTKESYLIYGGEENYKREGINIRSWRKTNND